MKTFRNTLVAIIAFSFAALSVVWAADRSSATPSEGWQHLAMDAGSSTKDSELGKKINELGRDGWELVTVTPVQEQGSTAKFIYFFKKPLK